MTAPNPATVPLTPDEIADRLIPTDPQISPDGRHVAFVVAPAGQKGEHREQAVWLARDGTPASPFTGGVAEDTAPRWSPDGTRLLFLSDRAERGVFRPYRIDLACGGEARPLGALDGKLSAPVWSPDGTRVALLRRDPESAEEQRRQEERDDPIVADADRRRTRLWLVDAVTGRARCLTYGSREVRSFAWAPDGERLAVVTTDEPGFDARYHPTALSLVPVAGGLARPVASFPSTPEQPTFVEAPNGPAIAVRFADGRADPARRVWIVPAEGGQPRALLADHDGNVDWVVAPPGRPGRLAIRTVEGVHATVYELEVATGALTPLLAEPLHGDGSVLHGPSLSADGARFAVVWADGAVPPEVYVGSAGGACAAVTTLGAPFRGRLSPVETVRWESDGIEIEGLLTLPAGYEPGRRYPLVVEVHGGPTWQWEDDAMLDWHDWAQLLAGRGYAVLAPNPRGSTGRGAPFQELLHDDVGGGEARDLIAGAQAMVARGIADPDRLGIGGWSWGGYLTARVTTLTTIFKAAVMGAGLANLVSDHGSGDIPSANLLYFPGLPYHHPDHYWERSPIRDAARVTTPTLILHGDADERVHPTQGAEWYRALKSLGVPAAFVRYPREDHAIKERAHQIDLMRRLVDWYDRWLKP